MRICLAQIRSLRAKIEENKDRHLEIINQAIEHHVELVFFPELSLINYEPGLARNLAMNRNSPEFISFQKKADSGNIHIAIGAPLARPTKPCISLFLFSPHIPCRIYSKQVLHQDEVPYFSPGLGPNVFDVNGRKIGWGICYESLRTESIQKAKNQGAEIYLASVAKNQEGVEKAMQHFPQKAIEFQIPIMMANGLGLCEGFHAAGQSCIWTKDGLVLDQLDDNQTGILVYELNTI